MTNVASVLQTIYQILEDDKTRMGVNIDPKMFDRISDAKRTEFSKRASAATNEYEKLYWIYRAIGYPDKKSQYLAIDTMKKDKDVVGVEDVDIYTRGGTEEPEVDVSLHYKDLGYYLIKEVRKRFPNDDNALKILTLHLIRGFPQDPDNVTFDEYMPHEDIPHYKEVLAVLHRGEKKTAEHPMAWKGGTVQDMITDPPPEGLGITRSHYYRVREFLGHAIAEYKEIQRDEMGEAFISNIIKLFGDKEHKLSNMEPLEHIINRDTKVNKYKHYGIHLQGVLKDSGGGDVIKDSDIVNIKHQYTGSAMVLPLEGNNLQKILKKAVPGKKVILFGANDKPKPLGKGWENFQYRIMTDPVVLGVYTISPENKSESLIGLMNVIS